MAFDLQNQLDVQVLCGWVQEGFARGGPVRGAAGRFVECIGSTPGKVVGSVLIFGLRFVLESTVLRGAIRPDEIRRN